MEIFSSHDFTDAPRQRMQEIAGCDVLYFFGEFEDDDHMPEVFPGGEVVFEKLPARCGLHVSQKIGTAAAEPKSRLVRRTESAKTKLALRKQTLFPGKSLGLFSDTCYTQ